MVREDLIVEKIAVDSYREIILYLGDDDVTARIAIEQIMGKEEGHAGDMKKLLDRLAKHELAADDV